MRTVYTLSAFLFHATLVAAHTGPHNASHTHMDQGVYSGDPVAVAAIVTGLGILAAATWYAVKDYRKQYGGE